MQIAVFLLYIRAAFGILFGTFLNPIGLVLIAGMAAAGFGIANEKKWGYTLGIAMSLAPALLRMAAGGPAALLGRDPIGLMFEVALIALLLHPMSRDYQRIWFS
jgi:hypothetical protein